MQTDQGFRLVTRGLSVACLLLAFVQAMYIASDFLNALHYWRITHTPGITDAYFRAEVHFFKEYMLRTAVLVLQTTVLLWASLCLYQGGPKVRRFFLPDTNTPA